MGTPPADYTRSIALSTASQQNPGNISIDPATLHVIYTDPLGVAHELGGGPAPVASETVYVSKGGSDITGTGTLGNPYLTINKAMTSIVDASQAKPYAIDVGAGNFNDNFTMKPWVGIIGQPASSGFEGITQIGCPGLNLLDPSWNNGNTYGVAWMAHVTLNNTYVFDFDAVSNLNGQLTFFDCMFNAGATFNGHGAGNVNNITWDNCLSYAGATVTGCQFFFTIGGTAFQGGTVSINSSASGQATTWLSLGGCVNGNATFLWNPAHPASSVSSGIFVGCDVTGTLTLNGLHTAFQATVGGVPPTVTLLGGAPAPTLNTKANSLGYAANPTTNWAGAAPTSVTSALDRMASLVKTLNGGVPIP